MEELLLVDLHGQTSDEDSILVELLNQGEVLLDRQDFNYYSLLRNALPESRSFGRARASIATSASFDHVLSLESYGLTAIRIEERSELGVALRWRVTGTPLEDYHVSLRVTDDRGYMWGQYDALLQDERGHTVNVWQQDQTYDTLLAVSLTEGVPPGSYCLGVRLYKPGDLSTLPVLDAVATCWALNIRLPASGDAASCRFHRRLECGSRGRGRRRWYRCSDSPHQRRLSRETASRYGCVGKRWRRLPPGITPT